jgi:drug/metabolite transporter (DMT)-like permease
VAGKMSVCFNLPANDVLYSFGFTSTTSISSARSGFSVLIVTGEHFYFRNLFTLDTLMGLVIGAGFNIVSSLFTSFSFQNLEAHFASQILLLENVFSPIIGLTFYGERLDQIIVFGALIVVFCIIISNYLLTD